MVKNYDIDYRVSYIRSKLLKLRGLGKSSDLLSGLCRKCLTVARKYNNSCEVGLCYNIETGQYKLFYGNDRSVSVDNEEFDSLSNGKQILVFVHNHPNNSEFSNADISSFIDIDTIVCLIAVGNTSDTYLLYKTSDYNMIDAKRIFNKARHDAVNNGGYAADLFVKRAKSCGIYYKKVE